MGSETPLSWRIQMSLKCSLKTKYNYYIIIIVLILINAVGKHSMMICVQSLQGFIKG